MKSFDMYRTLKYMCELHGIPHHDIPRSTLHTWSRKGVDDVYIESLVLRLVSGSSLGYEAINDLAMSLGYLFTYPLPPDLVKGRSAASLDDPSPIQP